MLQQASPTPPVPSSSDSLLIALRLSALSLSLCLSLRLAAPRRSNHLKQKRNKINHLACSLYSCGSLPDADAPREDGDITVISQIRSDGGTIHTTGVVVASVVVFIATVGVIVVNAVVAVSCLSYRGSSRLARVSIGRARVCRLWSTCEQGAWGVGLAGLSH